MLMEIFQRRQQGSKGHIAMTKFSTIKTALGCVLSGGKERLRYFSSGRAALALVFGVVVLMLGFSLFSFDTAASVMRRVGRRARPAASATPAAIPPECEIPEGAIKLSKCSGRPVDAVIVGGPQGTGECKSEGPITAYVDQALLNVGQITIGAGSSLKLLDRTAQLPVGLLTNGIQVLGTLEIGNAKCPIGTINPATEVSVTFKGSKQACGDPDNDSYPCPGYTKGIEVEAGASLRLYGAKGVPSNGVSWTYLGAAAGPTTYDAAHNVKAPSLSASSITVADDVASTDVTKKSANWQVNDWIAVAGTGFSPFETEFVQIASFGALTAQGRVVNLTQPLKFYHFGSTAPSSGTSPSCGGGLVPASYCDGSDKNFGVDERAEVGLDRK